MGEQGIADVGDSKGRSFTKVQVAWPSLANDLVIMPVVRQHALVARPESPVCGHEERALAICAALH